MNSPIYRPMACGIAWPLLIAEKHAPIQQSSSPRTSRVLERCAFSTLEDANVLVTHFSRLSCRAARKLLITGFLIRRSQVRVLPHFSADVNTFAIIIVNKQSWELTQVGRKPWHSRQDLAAQLVVAVLHRRSHGLLGGAVPRGPQGFLDLIRLKRRHTSIHERFQKSPKVGVVLDAQLVIIAVPSDACFSYGCPVLNIIKMAFPRSGR